MNTARLALIFILWTAAAYAQSAPVPHVHFIATGGTISNRTEGRLTADELVKTMPGVEQYARLTTEQFANVASSELTVDQWLQLSRRINKLFASDPELARSIRFLILHHQRAHQYDEEWTDSAVRRFAREIGPDLADLMALSRADMTTKRREKRRRFLFQLKDLQQRISALAAEDAKVAPLPKGLGDALMQAFGLPPSRRLGELRRALELAVESGELPAQQPNEVYLEFVRRQPARFGLTPSEVGS